MVSIASYIIFRQRDILKLEKTEKEERLNVHPGSPYGGRHYRIQDNQQDLDILKRFMQ